ncbi:uncharacterized protein PHACADRAFT_261209 [Phanerochaete carnosa HHB-10118-sp]|uniref:Uncharacterized protein n=1 Tax=Phanerochaete carnosa (strain HHB-10118-sp) TaxID=650164 RepID=K5URW6_PHACS|nr:uncharacterized protein PHACADRAFT_261209 [Phanerochaete carnosa HHB-10118-sp]EKM52641.1 hypothetical protein PHACADRAFT_261209 [Phanerochaete carnosa HHB-10118-sp]
MPSLLFLALLVPLTCPLPKAPALLLLLAAAQLVAAKLLVRVLYAQLRGVRVGV